MPINDAPKTIQIDWINPTTTQIICDGIAFQFDLTTLQLIIDYLMDSLKDEQMT